MEFFERQVERHKSVEDGEEHTDYVSAFLKEIKARNGKDSYE